MTKKLRQNISKTVDAPSIGDLVRYYNTDPHGIIMGGGVGVVINIYYNERSYSNMYRVLTQNTGLQLWFNEDEVELNKSNVFVLGDDIKLEYNWTDHRIYRHRFPINDSYSNGYSLGFWAGPHAQEFLVNYFLED